ncbi:transporter%2C divalent anion:Na+ symporter (DASS) family [uncultured Roseburia sp.]|uniref:SLC13 family permease n=1 Tax=Brotonthovivens ammoniilytica TaxID=2981725 RepID=A0ABT2TIX3_9FIRM|nr:SLC13 family permease [Brotonthovivens ammoniilytica]MCU6761582.1 SLC13 family permease [Brotonthovivens ammoniilytica]SCI32682.1 transporter%2C divalent anion:Na+ symporter (DASS) family [uncultured Roseburia sp.]
MQTYRKKYLHIIIAIVIGIILLNAIPAVNGLTGTGVRVIAVFVPVLYLWLTVGTDWPSWLALALIFMTGVLSPDAVYSGTFGTSLIITVIGMLAFSKVLVDTGVIDTAVKWAITREFVRGRPYVFMAIIFLICAVLSFFMDVGAVTLVFISVITVICNEIGYKKGDPFFTAMMLGLFWITNAFNGGSPLGHALPLIMINSAAGAGYDISIAKWMSIGVPAAILITLIAIVFICLIWKPEASKFNTYDLDAHKSEVKPLTIQGKITIIMLLLVVLYWVLPTIFPSMLPENIKAVYSAYGTAFPLIIAMVLLCIIHIKGRPITTFREMTSTSTVTVLLFIGAVTVLGNAVSSPETGISACLTNILSPITSSMSIYAIVIIALLGCVILTNFISNTVCMLLFFSISVPLISAAGGNVIPLIILLCVMACFASLVPSAAITAPFYFGNENITVKNSLKWNLIMIALAWAGVSFIIYPASRLMM